MRVKICGVTDSEQSISIVALGAKVLGFMCVSTSPRYLKPNQIKTIVDRLPSAIDKVGVFANAEPSEIVQIVKNTGLTGVQLHGNESPSYCQQIRKLLANNIELIKAFRIENAASLAEIENYYNCIDTLLLDAYHPQLLGGTGATIDWSTLANFQPQLPWFLAGGLTPNNIVDALNTLKPDGIDLSSGVERSPGDKDLDKVADLFAKLGKKAEGRRQKAEGF